MRAVRSLLPDAASLAALIAMTVSASIILTAKAQAAGSGMPWEQPLQQVLESVQGPVAKIIAVMIIIVTGLTLASARPQAVSASSSKSSSGCRLPLPPLPSFCPSSALAAGRSSHERPPKHCRQSNPSPRGWV